MRTSWLPAQGGVFRIPGFGGKRSEKKGLGQWKDRQLMVVRLSGRGDSRLTKDGGKQVCPAQPSLAVRSLGVSPCTWVPLPGAKLQEVHTPRHQQALEGRLSLLCPQCMRVTGSVCARASGAPRKRCFPSQWGYFWLCSCSHCGNCTCLVQCGNMSFPREMYSKQAARKLPPLLVGGECLPASLPTHPLPPPHTTPSPLSLPLS